MIGLIKARRLRQKWGWAGERKWYLVWRPSPESKVINEVMLSFTNGSGCLIVDEQERLADILESKST